jgi:hypothetical protein
LRESELPAKQAPKALDRANEEVRESMRQVDQRTGRPLIDGRDDIEGLTDEELEVELTIAVGDPERRGERLDSLLFERTKRRTQLAPSA